MNESTRDPAPAQTDPDHTQAAPGAFPELDELRRETALGRKILAQAELLLAEPEGAV